MEGWVINLLQRIERNSHEVTAQVREVVKVGPFQALIDPSCDMTWLNYAVAIAPLEGLELSVALLELRQVFANRDALCALSSQSPCGLHFHRH